MSAPGPYEKVNRGVYGVFDGTTLMYAGSTAARLENLERNHREWRKKEYSWTMFREALEARGQDWKFVWLAQPKPRTAYEVETIEGIVIRSLEPPLNKDMDPVQSSINRNRYKVPA